MNICESLTVTARLFPEQIALVFQGVKYTYRQLDELSFEACRVLQDHGLKPQDRVAIQIGNNPAFPVWYYATLRAGGIAVSISTRLSLSERDFIVEDSAAEIMVSDQRFENAPSRVHACFQAAVDGKSFRQVVWVDGEAARTEAGTEQSNFRNLEQSPANQDTWLNSYDAAPDDPALILYTSGTTGFPKGATLSHANVRTNVAAFNHLCNMRKGDRVLLAVPLFHCFGQNALLNSVLNVGGTLVLQERFDLNESKMLISDYRVNQLYGVPMMFQLLLESCNPADLSSVEYCFSAAAPLATLTSQAWRQKFGQPIYEGYGLTETSPFASYNHRNSFLEGSIGAPIDGVEMKVIDAETGDECPHHQLGEIAIRGPNVMLGYWNRPEETAQAVRNGWFFSGDIGKRDEVGYFFLVDRVKDMIAVGGMKVFPAEVERVLRQIDGVSDVAVVGIEEPVLGEQVIGFITQDSDSDSSFNLDEAIRQARQELAAYKVPRRIFVIDQLPRNPSGKVLKTDLRELAREKMQTESRESAQGSENIQSASAKSESTTASPVATGKKMVEAGGLSADSAGAGQRLLESPLLERLAGRHPAEKEETIIDALSELIQLLTGEVDLPETDRTFLEIGMDSLMLVELGTQLQLELNLSEPLPATLLFDHPRIKDLATYVLRQIEGTDRDGNFAQADLSDSVGNPASRNSSSDDLLKRQVERLSEEEALQELLKELE